VNGLNVVTAPIWTCGHQVQASSSISKTGLVRCLAMSSCSFWSCTKRLAEFLTLCETPKLHSIEAIVDLSAISTQFIGPCFNGDSDARSGRSPRVPCSIASSAYISFGTSRYVQFVLGGVLGDICPSLPYGP
jgi:hypothetical protein